jgi:UDP-2,3-diacylglucosamine hydrolase
MKSLLFIADLHLSPERPDITQAFLQFLDREVAQHDALYILGDLFETWIGDDDYNVFTETVSGSIKTFSDKTPVYFIHGNRDFLLGERFAKKAGMTLLPEQHTIHIGKKSAIIMHGDQLCLDDVDYQAFRKKSRSWWWKFFIQLLPLSVRRKKADSYRMQSAASQQAKSLEIMDVAQREVQRILNNSKVDMLIHGHTHRPAIHQVNEFQQRIVVGDWYEQGSVLTLTENDAKLVSLPFDASFKVE